MYDIQKIVLYNRTDCCKVRLSNFKVYVSNVGFDNNADDAALREQSSWYTNYAGQVDDSLALTSVSGQKGRYVRIQMNTGGAVLSLAEVEVKGREIQLNRTPNGHSVRFNTTYALRNHYSMDYGNGYLKARKTYESSRYDSYTDACLNGSGNDRCVSAAQLTSNQRSNPYETHNWYLIPVAANGITDRASTSAVQCDDAVYVVNKRTEPFTNGKVTHTYLTRGNGGCNGNKYCVAGTSNGSIAGDGRGIWQIKCEAGSEGQLKKGQAFHLVNGLFNRYGGGYLDIRGRVLTYYKKNAAATWVSTATSPTRDGKSGTWSFE